MGKEYFANRNRMFSFFTCEIAWLRAKIHQSVLPANHETTALMLTLPKELKALAVDINIWKELR